MLMSLYDKMIMLISCVSQCLLKKCSTTCFLLMLFFKMCQIIHQQVIRHMGLTKQNTQRKLNKNEFFSSVFISTKYCSEIVNERHDDHLDHVHLMYNISFIRSSSEFVRPNQKVCIRGTHSRGYLVVDHSYTITVRCPTFWNVGTRSTNSSG